jgi:hypothetical protein
MILCVYNKVGGSGSVCQVLCRMLWTSNVEASHIRNQDGAMYFWKVLMSGKWDVSKSVALELRESATMNVKGRETVTVHYSQVLYQLPVTRHLKVLASSCSSCWMCCHRTPQPGICAVERSQAESTVEVALSLSWYRSRSARLWWGTVQIWNSMTTGNRVTQSPRGSTRLSPHYTRLPQPNTFCSHTQEFHV